MIPKILIKKESKYKLLKIYKDFALYENIKTKAKECFSIFQLGLVQEVVKPEKTAYKGGIGKH